MITEILDGNQQNKKNDNEKTIFPKSSTYQQKMKTINSNVLDMLVDDIMTDKIVIPQQEKPFKLKQKKQNLNQKLQGQMQKILSKKQQIQRQLKKIQSQQFKLHINNSKLNSNTSRLIDYNLTNSQIKLEKRFKSEITQQDNLKIKQILKSQKKCIKKFQQKQKQYYKLLEQNRIHNLQIQENIKKQKCQQRKKYWQKVRQEINHRQQQRKIKHKQQKQKLIQVKKSKKLYQKLEETWKLQQNQKHQKIKQQASQIKQNFKVSLQKIKEHQIQYDKIIKQRQQIWSKNQQEQKQNLKNTFPQIHKSKYYQQVQQQKRRKIQQSEQKQKKRLQLIQKRLQFANKVKQDYKPKIDEELKNQLAQLKKTKQQKIDKRQSMPFGQIKNIGNKYMSLMNKKVDVNKAKQLQQSKLKQLQELKKKQKPSYQNYLTALKNQRKSTEYKEGNVTQKVSKIMKDLKLSVSEKLQRTKQMARKLQIKENQKSSELISKINEKIKILQVLTDE